MFNVWATVSTIVHLPTMFSPTEFRFEKRIGLVSMDLLYTIFTYYTRDNQQECFGFSILILLAVFGAVDEPLASWVMVQFLGLCF